MYFPETGLYALIKKSLEDIDALDGGDPATATAFSAQLMAARPDLFSRFSQTDANEIGAVLAAGMIGIIKEIPQIAEAMLTAIDRRTTAPPTRCALAGALSYLVRPRDLLPDELPGGYGFVDDCIILRATITEFLGVLPQGFTTAAREKRLLELLAVCVPPDRLDEFQAEVDGIWFAYHVCLWEAEEDVDEMVERLIAAPLETELPSADRATIPLPQNPRLSIEPGGEVLEPREDGVTVFFPDGGEVLVRQDGAITAWN